MVRLVAPTPEDFGPALSTEMAISFESLPGASVELEFDMLFDSGQLRPRKLASKHSQFTEKDNLLESIHQPVSARKENSKGKEGDPALYTGNSACRTFVCL